MNQIVFPQSQGRTPGQRFAFLVFLLAIGAGAIYCVMHLLEDLAPVRESSVFPYVLLGVALLIALGFEFVNGFHDTANAVATVIYTHSLTPNLAVVWSGTWNFIGVLISSGAVAFGILQLLPVELIIGVGSSQGFAMVFALLIAAIIWNLGTWALGLPSSSSHTLIGSVIGVGLMNQMLHGTNGTSGVDWSQAVSVGKSLLFSPLVGFVLAGLLLYVLKLVVRVPALYKEPKKSTPPPFWIRCLLILTCTGVSFAHGSNDGQKGMGLIMLILIGTVPTAYALNKAVTPAETQTFLAVSHSATEALNRYSGGASPASDARAQVERYVQTKTLAPDTVASLKALMPLPVLTDVRRLIGGMVVPTGGDQIRKLRVRIVANAFLGYRRCLQPVMLASTVATIVLDHSDGRTFSLITMMTSCNQRWLFLVVVMSKTISHWLSVGK